MEALIDQAPIEVQELLACNSNMTDKLLDRLLSPDRAELHCNLAAKSDLKLIGLPLKRLFLRLVQNKVTNIASRIKIGKLLVSRLHYSSLELLLIDTPASVRAAVAKRWDLPIAVILRLAEDKAEVVQQALAKNQSITHEILLTLLEQSNRRVRELVARHCNASTSILENLANEPIVQEHVARNPITPSTILETLASSGKCDIALTQNPRIDKPIVEPLLAKLVQPILAKLAQDPSYTVRKLVARHPQTPQAILTQLAQDPEPKVQHLAQKRLAE
jgi:hypothetical protein